MPRPSAALVSTLLVAAAITSPLIAQGPPAPSPLPGLEYSRPFFPGATHDAQVPTPDQVLGFPVGRRPATHAQTEAVIRAIASKSPRVRIEQYGTSHEGRPLYNVFISSEANIRRLDELRAECARLADPRRVPEAEGDRLAQTLPLVAWMAYVIHGDEISGGDAALALVWHLASCTDEGVRTMLEEMVIVVDPLMNPDGRDRWLSMLQQNRTAQPNVDDQSLVHTGSWPSGRMNHYLFDLNRDWIFGTQPESRGRIRAVRDWNPHFLLESHEMGSQDTFLFQPAREPFNPNTPAHVLRWSRAIADDHGRAFDGLGWRYYTGEWNEEWYPGYSGSWASLRNAIGQLYEQATITTDAVRRPEGTLEAYREAVHKQLVSSLANLSTLYTNRRAILRDFVAQKRANVAHAAPRYFAVPPTANTGRLRDFTDLLTLQGIEMFTVKGATVSGKDRLGRAVQDLALPEGTILIPTAQPLANLVAAMLEFDPRMAPAFLEEERRELLRFGRSRLYDITGWNVTMMFDLEAYEVAGPLPEGAAPYTPPADAPATLDDPNATVCFAIDGADDRSVSLAGRLLERGVRVRVADKACEFSARKFARGSLFITRVDNQNFGGDLAQAVTTAAAELGLGVAGLSAGQGAGDLPDLGGQHFVLLEQPRVAVMARDTLGPYGVGEVWHHIDHVLGIRASLIDADYRGSMDLRRYNVVVVPDGGPGAEITSELKAWVESGGTLIAVGSAAAGVASPSGMGGARLLPEVVTKPDDYRMAIVRDWYGQAATVDPDAVWSHVPPASVEYPWVIKEENKPSDEELKRRDAWRAIFMPQGAILAGRVDDRSWLTSGCGPYVPVVFQGDTVMLTPVGVEAPVRLGAIVPMPRVPSATSPAQPAPSQPQPNPYPGWSIAPPAHELRLRMSGLLWPEAAERLAHAAYVTRERVGNGQVILFASSPTFRAAAKGTSRIFSNAVVFGPGMGADKVIRP